MNNALPVWVQYLAALGPPALAAALILVTLRYTGHTARMVAEMTADREDRQRQLVGRVKSNLERIQRLSDRVRGHQSDTPFSADVGDELEVIWNTYYSVADPIFILRGEDLPERVDAYFQDLRTAGLLIRNLEATAEATQPWAEKRAAKIAAVVKLGQDANGLLEEVNRTW